MWFGHETSDAGGLNQHLPASTLSSFHGNCDHCKAPHPEWQQTAAHCSALSADGMGDRINSSILHKGYSPRTVFELSCVADHWKKVADRSMDASHFFFFFFPELLQLEGKGNYSKEDAFRCEFTYSRTHSNCSTLHTVHLYMLCDTVVQ